MSLISLVFVTYFAYSEVNIVAEYVALNPNTVTTNCFSCPKKVHHVETIEFGTMANYLPKKQWGQKYGLAESLKATPRFSASDEMCTDPADHESIGFRLVAEIGKKTPSGRELQAKVSLSLPLRGQSKPKLMNSERTIMVSANRTLTIEFPSMLRDKEIDSDRLAKACPKSVLNKFLATSADKTAFFIALTPVTPARAP